MRVVGLTTEKTWSRRCGGYRNLKISRYRRYRRYWIWKYLNRADMVGIALPQTPQPSTYITFTDGSCGVLITCRATLVVVPTEINKKNNNRRAGPAEMWVYTVGAISHHRQRVRPWTGYQINRPIKGEMPTCSKVWATIFKLINPVYSINRCFLYRAEISSILNSIFNTN